MTAQSANFGSSLSLPFSPALREMNICPENQKIYIHNLMLFEIKSTELNKESMRWGRQEAQISLHCIKQQDNPERKQCEIDKSEMTRWFY